jgi:RHS repeat-associated protein
VDIVAKDLQKKEAPEAYLMYALYDKDSNRYEVGKKVLSKNAANQHEVLEENMYISKDGYMETFVVNETSEDVWFDNMMVMSMSSPVAQETHYDPWGLELTGIGYQYPQIKANKFLYNGKELIEDNGLQYYDYGARMYDPAIGRWGVVDPMASEREFVSTFNFVQNNPLSRVDPDGMFDIRIHGENSSSVTIVTDLIDIDVNAGSLVGDLGGNYSLQGDDILSAGLDIVGVVDPTGIADGLNAGLQAKNGDWLGAAISTAGIIPFIGDVAKVGKIGKDVNIIKNAIEAVHGNSKLSQKAQHGYEIFNNKTGDILEYGISGQKRSNNQMTTGGSPRIDQKLRTKYSNNPDVEGRVIDGNLGNRQQAIDWEKSKVKEFRTNNNNQKPSRQIKPN